jgi:hypothetical protein
MLSFIFHLAFHYNSSAQIQLGTDITSAQTRDICGYDVSLSHEGNRMAISYSSSVSVFEYNGIDWVQMGEDLEAEEGNNVYISLSGNGDILAIGDFSSVRILEYDGTEWVQIGQDILNGNFAGSFGHRVSLSEDGLSVGVGVASNAASVFVYKFENDEWIQVGQAILQDPDEMEYTGMSVSISENGNTIGVAIPGISQVRIYELIADEWLQKGSDIENEGFYDEGVSSISLSSNGQKIAIGAPNWSSANSINIGRVRVFEYETDAWNQIGNDMESDGAEYVGGAVSLSNDGTTLGTGYHWGGSAKIYKLENNVWIQKGATLETGSFSVSVSGNGNIAAFGNPLFDNNGPQEGVYHGLVQVFGDFVTSTAGDFNEKNQINIYPNPSAGFTTIDLGENHQIESIAIRNVLGKTVDAFAITNSIKQVEFDINGMPGLYLIDVISNTGIHKVYKLIKSN